MYTHTDLDVEVCGLPVVFETSNSDKIFVFPFFLDISSSFETLY